MPYGDFDTVMDVVARQLAGGPWLLGERFTTADVLWGGALSWTLRFGMVPERPEFTSYVERFDARPSAAWVRERDDALAAEHEAAIGGA
jgi:glutathione S-transferase